MGLTIRKVGDVCETCGHQDISEVPREHYVLPTGRVEIQEVNGVFWGRHKQLWFRTPRSFMPGGVDLLAPLLTDMSPSIDELLTELEQYSRRG